MCSTEHLLSIKRLIGIYEYVVNFMLSNCKRWTISSM